jgi:hypothetical protein
MSSLPQILISTLGALPADVEQGTTPSGSRVIGHHTSICYPHLCSRSMRKLLVLAESNSFLVVKKVYMRMTYWRAITAHI